jgi:protein-S-isoprenylcysteine O-methyltransferase Ste14
MGGRTASPVRANLVGVLPVGAGAALLVRAMTGHYRAAPHGWDMRLAPAYLLKGGPHRFSRNPMYVGEAAIWAGWAMLFGSVPVAGGLVMLTAIQAGAVRLEECPSQAVRPRLRRLPGADSSMGQAAGSHPGCGQPDSKASNLGRGS